MAVSKARIEANLRRVQDNVAAACARRDRKCEDVRLVAVTKSADMAAVRCLIDLGVADLGESRAQQLAARAAELAETLQRRREPPARPPRWHMVGHLQRNKVKTVLEWANVIHSVDSLRLAEEINERSLKLGRAADVFLQVNCSREEQKFGMAVAAAGHFAEMLSTLKGLRVVGLMTMAPLSGDPEGARPAFVRLRELFEEMRREGIGGDSFRHLSMGMSQDYVVAVEEGATVLRIGTALFE